jgi:hypothetical protein
MLDQLLQAEIQNFINLNIESNITELALKKNPFPELDYTVLLNQILAKQKAKLKLPTWFDAQNIIFPEKISIEQTSSEKTAQYKASLIKGESLIDLSGGFGIDDYYFAKHFKEVIHCEINNNLSEIVQHNYNVLKISNIKCFSGESTAVLKTLNRKFDWIYVDPSRRHDKKGKVFLLNDCEPNVPQLLSFYFKYSENILIKTAPILDIQSGLNELQFVKRIHIIALENEVKELLWEIEANYSGEVHINSINIEKESITEDFAVFKKDYKSNFSTVQKYLYEPNAALMKSGEFSYVSEKYKIAKLHQHSHLYTNNELITFPGRSFEIIECIPFQKNDLKKHITNQKMNISTRNFPLKVDEIKKKFKIKDGGTIFAFFTTDIENNKIVLLCKKTTP